MTTYTALFNRPATQSEAETPPSIIGVLSQHFSGTFEVQHGSPTSKDWVLVSLDTDLHPEDVEVAFKLAFPIGLGPVLLLPLAIPEFRDACHARGFHGVWTQSAWLNNQREEQETQQLLGLVNVHADVEFATFTALRDAKAPFWPLWRALRDQEARIKQLQVLPERPVLENEREQLRTEMAQLLSRWTSLHERALDIDRQLAVYGGIYNTNPRYTNRVGNMNLAVQAVVHEYMERFAPTDSRYGELEEGADEQVHELGWRLINILDGEWDSSQQLQIDAEEKLEQLGFDPNIRATNLQKPQADRLTAYRTIEAEFTDYLGHVLSELQGTLGLADDDLN